MKSYFKNFVWLLILFGLFACHSSRISTVNAPDDVQWREPGTFPMASAPAWAATTEIDSSLTTAQPGNLLPKAPNQYELMASTSANTDLLAKVKELSHKPKTALEAMAQNKKAPGSRITNLVTKLAIKKAIRKSEKWQARADDDKPRKNSLTRNNFFIIGAVFLAAGGLLIIFGGVPGTIIASIMGLILLVAALALLITALALNLFNGNSISIG